MQSRTSIDSNQGHPVENQLSLSKHKIRILLLENVNDSAVELIEQAGYRNITRLTEALDGATLRDAIKGVHLLGIRSRTDLSEEVLAAADLRWHPHRVTGDHNMAEEGVERKVLFNKGDERGVFVPEELCAERQVCVLDREEE
jgi:phosphoglycerate dehydrogenase-like enzyme